MCFINARKWIAQKRIKCYARFYNKVSTIDGLDNLSMQKEQNGGPYAILLILVETHFERFSSYCEKKKK